MRLTLEIQPTLPDEDHSELSFGLGARHSHRFVPGSFDGKEITTAVSLRLLPLEMLYEGESFKNHEYRK
jgi:hypothetical protein